MLQVSPIGAKFPGKSHLHDGYAAIGRPIAPPDTIQSGIAIANPLGVGDGEINSWTTVASTLFFATTDFIDDPGL